MLAQLVGGWVDDVDGLRGVFGVSILARDGWNTPLKINMKH